MIAPTDLAALAEMADDLACLYCPDAKDQNELTRIIKTLRALASQPAGGEADAAYWREMARAANARADGGEWISVKDGFPPENVPVWCSIDGAEPFFGAYCYADGEEDGSGWVWMRCDSRPYLHSGKWTCDDIEWDDQYDVTHWQPLPAIQAGRMGGENNSTEEKRDE